MARGYQLSTRLVVDRNLEETFAFFAEPGNLQRLTPPWLDFSILTASPIAMRVGAIIDYRIKLRGLPVRWRSEITDWTPPHRFVDEQRFGPYAAWRHSHAFLAVPGGTQVDDIVRYRPFGGALTHALFVRRDLERIFTFRQEALLAAFGLTPVAPIHVQISPVLL